MKKVTTEQYIDYIKGIVEAEGWRIADKANKIALENKQINVAMYSKAARLIARAFLGQ